jgi:predicted SAM-dependent methyltransferase
LPPAELAEINDAFKKYWTTSVDYICDANDLTSLGKEQFDFVIANHVFEHLRNPLKSLESWHYILKSG